MKVFLKAVLGAAVLAACGCGESTEADGGEGITVAATTGMIGDVAQQVAGETVPVSSIIGEGVDPHLYKPTSSDLKRLFDADVVFYNGLHLEGKMGEVLEKLAARGKEVTAVAEVLSSEANYLISGEEGVDPHVWMDVQAWIKVVDEVEKVLSAADGGAADTFRANADRYKRELTALNAYARKVLQSIPKDQRVLVTAHDAFGYMEKAYGLEVHGIQGLSTESEASLQGLEALIKMLVDRKIPAVFVESSVSQKNVKALVEGAAAQGHTLTIGGELFSDAMGPAGTYEGTYIGMIDHNVTTIARALGGEAPEKGMNGKLK